MQSRHRQHSTGKKVGRVDLADDVFGAEVKEHLLYEVVKAQLAARRAGTHATKTPRRGRAAAARSPTSRRAPATRARARSARRTTSAAARCSGPQPRDYAYTVPQEGAARRARARRCRCAPRRRSWSIVDALRARRVKTKRLAGVLEGAGRRQGRSSSTTRPTTNLRAVGAQPRRTPSSCRPRASTSTTSCTTRASCIADGRRQGARGALLAEPTSAKAA